MSDIRIGPPTMGELFVLSLLLIGLLILKPIVGLRRVFDGGERE